jgi:hypothetical protein
MLKGTSAGSASQITRAWESQRSGPDVVGEPSNLTQARGVWPTTSGPRSSTGAARTIRPAASFTRRPKLSAGNSPPKSGASGAHGVRTDGDKNADLAGLAQWVGESLPVLWPHRHLGAWPQVAHSRGMQANRPAFGAWSRVRVRPTGPRQQVGSVMECRR